MHLRAGYPFGLIKNGLPHDYPKLEKDRKTDVLVIGGGISGALAAHYLVQENIDCILVDARTIGLGSTCASTSLLQYEIDTALHQLIPLVGKKNAVRAYQLCEKAIFKIKAVAAQTGVNIFSMKNSLYVAAYKKHIPFIRQEYETRKKYGFEVSYIEEKDMADQFGFNAPAAILSAVGAQTDAYLLTHHLLIYNMKKGLAVYDRTPVVSVVQNKNAVIAYTKNGYSIKAKKILYATGYEVVDVIHEPIVKLHSTYASISESFNTSPLPAKKDVLIWNTADPYLYMRTTPDNRILVGGRDEMFFSPAKRDKLIAAKAKKLRADFNKLFPHIPFNTEFSWCGTYGSTKDGLPYIGEHKKFPNSYFSLGFGGNGITFSQVAGEMIAAMIKGKKNKDAPIFSFERK